MGLRPGSGVTFSLITPATGYPSVTPIRKSDMEDTETRIKDLELATATQTAAMVGAETTQAAALAGAAATATAMQAGNLIAMAVGSVALVVGMFLGITIGRK